MQVQHAIGADIIFAFDECTTLMNTREYQERSLRRTHDWAERCIEEHVRLTAERTHRPYQSLFGVVQGAQYEDLRRKAARGLAALDFDGFGIGGALEKDNLGTIIQWVNEELPEDKPRHLLGIGDPTDFFTAVEHGVDTFDCVAPSRMARNGTVLHPDGRFHVTNARYKTDFNPIDHECDCYTCTSYSRAYLHHLFKAKERLSATLTTIHNERFIVRLMDQIRLSIPRGEFNALREEFLGRFHANESAS